MLDRCPDVQSGLQGLIQDVWGGGAVGQSPPPPPHTHSPSFLDHQTSNNKKEGEPVACMYTNTTHFSTQQLPGISYPQWWLYKKGVPIYPISPLIKPPPLSESLNPSPCHQKNRSWCRQLSCLFILSDNRRQIITDHLGHKKKELCCSHVASAYLI